MNEKDTAPMTPSSIKTDRVPVAKDKLVIKEEPVEPTASDSAVNSSLSSASTNGLVMVVIFLALLAGAIYLGFSTERQYGGLIFQKLPPALIKKMVKTQTPAPSPGLPITKNPLVAPSSLPTPPPSPSPAAESEAAPPSDQGVEASPYVLSFSDSRKVTSADLRNLTDWELKVARNEIYARHGRPFVHQDLACYFAKQSWYVMDPEFSASSLSALESANAAFILNYEKEAESSLINKDTGCK